jgi:hypothetical protein
MDNRARTMQLGIQMWNTAESFYERLTLGNDGDPDERHGASQHGLDRLFSQYETFWKRHVCPATNRPRGITFRPGVADIVSVITQRNYTIFIYLLEAYEFLSPVLQGEYGLRKRNCYTAIMYAGNALQVFAELQSALCGKPEKLTGMKDLADELGVCINPFPHWSKNWQPDRESASNYRNYVTHQGCFYSVFHQASGEILVLKRDAFEKKATYTWTQADTDYASNPGGWTKLGEACKGIVDDTTAFLNRAYKSIVSELDKQLTNPAYQRLWGWKDDQPIPGTPAAKATAIAPSTWSPVSMAASTSSAVDSSPIPPKPGFCATHSPPGSGDKIV